MMGRRFLYPVFLGVIVVLASISLVACERPDPQDIVVQLPTLMPTAMPTPTVQPTQPPIQVYVVVVQPTPDGSQPSASNLPAIAPTVAPAALISSPTPVMTPEPTSLPPNYFQGWAMKDSLFVEDGRVKVDQVGIILRDRPSSDGEQVGVVIGYSEIFVVGRERCGYAPIMVYAGNMLSRTTPHLEVFPSEPLPTEASPFAPTPFAAGNATSGWAFTDELTLLGETAISGPVGINLRSDPCRAATNLGFMPAGSNMIIIGPSSSEYTPVRVSNDVLQLPFDFSAIGLDGIDDALSSRSQDPLPLATPTTSTEDVPENSPTPVPSITAPPKPSPSPTPGISADMP